MNHDQKDPTSPACADARLLRCLITAGTVAAGVIFAASTRAQTPSTQPASTQPAGTQSAGTALLRELSGETQSLYRQSRHSMVRVQLPTPQWLEQYNRRQQLLQKWGTQLDPQVREQIIEEQERYLAALHRPPTTNPATQSSDMVTIKPATAPVDSRLQIVEGPRPGEISISLFAVGLLVDDEGHAVFPVYVDRQHVGTLPLPAVTGEGQVTTATFVGSDAKTNLTVLQLADHTGAPAALGHAKPDDGALTLMISSDGAARLIVWNSQHPDPGFAILPDGAIAGFGFNGYFLGASTAKPIVDQLIATGRVHRAFLGVVTQDVDRDDGLRRQRPELGTRPAVRIIAVQDNSPASRAGIQPDDLVVAIGEQTVGDAPTFAAVIATRSGEMTLKVLRGQKAIDVKVNLQPR